MQANACSFHYPTTNPPDIMSRSSKNALHTQAVLSVRGVSQQTLEFVCFVFLQELRGIARHHGFGVSDQRLLTNLGLWLSHDQPTWMSKGYWRDPEGHNHRLTVVSSMSTNVVQHLQLLENTSPRSSDRRSGSFSPQSMDLQSASSHSGSTTDLDLDADEEELSESEVSEGQMDNNGCPLD